MQVEVTPREMVLLHEALSAKIREIETAIKRSAVQTETYLHPLLRDYKALLEKLG